MAERNVPFVTSLGVGAHLQRWGVRAENIQELDWWESFDLHGLRFTATPARHFSGRGLGTTNASLWSSWVLETSNHRVFFSGDTGLTPEFEDIGKRFGRFDLVILEIGAFHPSWSSIHLGPQNAIKAYEMLSSTTKDPGALMPVHWGTFPLALHPWDEPAEVLLERSEEKSIRLAMPKLGGSFEPSQLGNPHAWWRDVKTATLSLPSPLLDGVDSVLSDSNESMVASTHQP